MLSAWLRAGLDYDAFWLRTPREITTILTAREEWVRGEHDRQRSVAYELAGLIAFAMHEPKKLPKFEPTPKPVARAEGRSDWIDHERLRGWFVAQGARPSQKEGENV
ncbi:hypothetical protein [Haematobacter massiliensis]|uniref:hypothetical protein n=1 Tax=Haematobacter massiliensis TaxID=195105 RepID=UPI0023F271C9|nr:hypothetical protein [Haematobacter massiliensis]